MSALENRAVHDPNRLVRGRAYFRKKAVVIESISPGKVNSQVSGSREEPYRTTLFLKQFSPESWGVALEVVASSARFLAELLSGVISEDLEAALSVEELSLLPQSGEISFACDCPDWADPCKHSAALCYEFAAVLDKDPMNLVVLRGLKREELFRRLRWLRSPTSLDRLQPETNAVSLAELLARTESKDEPVRQSVVEEAPVGFRALVARPEEVPVDLGQSQGQLVSMIGWAAERARRALTGGLIDDFAPLPEVASAAAIAWLVLSGVGNGIELDSSFRGIRPAALAGAYDIAGLDGIKVMVESGTFTKEQRRLVREALNSQGSIDQGERIRISGNRATSGGVQLRCDASGNWYLFVAGDDGWELVSVGAPTPLSLLT